MARLDADNNCQSANSGPGCSTYSDNADLSGALRCLGLHIGFPEGPAPVLLPG